MMAQVAKSGRILMEPLAIDPADAELFSYRISNLLKSLSPFQVKLARLIENKKMILKSGKMREYFASHRNERNLLLDKLGKLSKKFHHNIIRIPPKVPNYLSASFLRDDERKQGRLNRFKKRMRSRHRREGEREKKERKTPRLGKKIKKKREAKSRMVDIPVDGPEETQAEVPEAETTGGMEEAGNELYAEEDPEDEFGFDEENYGAEGDDLGGEEESGGAERETQKRSGKEISQKDLRNFEHPLLRDPKTLKSFSSRKQWKMKHGIKKKKNRRLIRKGHYNI